MSDPYKNFSWRPTGVPLSDRWEDVFFLNDDLGWAVSYRGKY